MTQLSGKCQLANKMFTKPDQQRTEEYIKVHQRKLRFTSASLEGRVGY